MNKKITNILFSCLSALVVVMTLASVYFMMSDVNLAQAQNDSGFQIPFVQNNNTDLGNNVSLPTITDSTGTGALILIIKRILRYLQIILGSVGVTYAFIAAYRLVTAGAQIEDVATKEKQTLKYIIAGFLLVTLAEPMITNVFFRGQGAALSSPEAAKEAAKAGVQILRNATNYFVAFAGSVAVLMIILSGVRMTMSPGNQDVIDTQKKMVLWSSLGLILINLADRLVYIFFNEGGTEGVNVQAGLVELTGLTNYILGFLGVVAAASLIYAGVLLLINYGNTEVTGKVKTIVRDVVLGIIIAFSAYTIVSAIVRIAG